MQVQFGWVLNGNGVTDNMYLRRGIGQNHITTVQCGFPVIGNIVVVDTGGFLVIGDNNKKKKYNKTELPEV